MKKTSKFLKLFTILCCTFFRIPSEIVIIASMINTNVYIKIQNNFLIPSIENFLLMMKSFGWLVVWVLWHINLCRLFNAKSIFMQIVLFQTIQFSMSTQFNCQKTFLFQAIQFSQIVLNSAN